MILRLFSCLCDIHDSLPFYCASDVRQIEGLSEGMHYKPSTAHLNGHASSVPIPLAGLKIQGWRFHSRCHKATLVKEKNSLRQRGEAWRGTGVQREPMRFSGTPQNGIINHQWENIIKSISSSTALKYNSRNLYPL